MHHSLHPASALFSKGQQSKISTIFKILALATVTSLSLAGTATAQVASRAVWSMKRGPQDSVALRLGSLTPAPATLRRYVVSDGSTPSSGTTTIAYSASRGQAFAPTADGSGWGSTAAPAGPGSTPRRTFYEQFQVTATAATRLDSLLFTAAATSSTGGRVALMYSFSNFTADSSNFTGGKGPAYATFTTGGVTYPAFGGGVLPGTTDGSFAATGSTAANAAVLPQFASATGNSSVFRFGINGTSGITVAAGQTLTVRLYFTINNSSTGRYVLLKDVTLRGPAGTPTATVPARSAQPLAMYPNPALDNLTIAHPAALAGARVAVYSATGQQVMAAVAIPGTASTALNLSQLTSGIYFAEYTDGQQRIVGKLVKQ